jgi:hypothetical protein
VHLYYAMAGWDDTGRPSWGKLCELGIEGFHETVGR